MDTSNLCPTLTRYSYRYRVETVGSAIAFGTIAAMWALLLRTVTLAGDGIRHPARVWDHRRTRWRLLWCHWRLYWWDITLDYAQGVMDKLLKYIGTLNFWRALDGTFTPQHKLKFL